MCAAGTLTLREGRQKVGSATTSLIQEKRKANRRIQCKYCHQRVFSFTPSCTERNNKKGTFLLSSRSTVHQTGGFSFCIKFKFVMTAQGKRKENNEIKPLPPDLGWDVTTCLFSPALVFSQLSKFLCSCGSMIHLFRERKKKKTRGGRRGKKEQQLFFTSLFHLGLQALRVCSLGPKRDREAKGRVFGEAKRLFPLPHARWMKDNFKA